MPEKNAILVGSLNPSIDVTMGVDCLRAGGTNRARFVREDAGGKGVNVARALKAQGVESVRLAGFVWREGGNILENALKQAGVACDFCWLEGATRRNIKILDEEKAEITEVNAKSAPVAAEDVHFMREKLLCGAKDAKMVVLTGSLPTDCPGGFLCANHRGESRAVRAGRGWRGAFGGRAGKAVFAQVQREGTGRDRAGCNGAPARARGDGSGHIHRVGFHGSAGKHPGGRERRMARRAAQVERALDGWRGRRHAFRLLGGVCARGICLEAFRWAVASASASVEGEGTFMPGSAEAARYLPYIQIERLMEW